MPLHYKIIDLLSFEHTLKAQHIDKRLHFDHRVCEHGNGTQLQRLYEQGFSESLNSFGIERVAFTWIGNTRLLRGIISQILKTHPETSKTIFDLRFCHETEHSLALADGSSDFLKTPIGKVPSIYNNNEFYFVITQYCEPSRFDIVVQYSMPNIMNYQLSDVYHPSFVEKMVFVPAIECEYDPHSTSRDMTPFTTFSASESLIPGHARREGIIKTLWNSGILVQNYRGIKTADKMRELYGSKAILINLHQTPNFHTFEEFRALPALMRGLIVISEDSPLVHSIPYNEFIVWSSIDNLAATVSDVMVNYDVYFERFFGEASHLPCILAKMQNDAYSAMEDVVLRHHAARQV